VIGIQSGPRGLGSTLASMIMEAEVGMLIVETTLRYEVTRMAQSDICGSRLLLRKMSAQPHFARHQSLL
jgi:hypothetical protein